ncbi:MAG: cyclic nucleotide-binding domain-containing protein [Burkholderiaceae bacterium]|nr:cyclic nucleotide-binding domain-containing protein [Burkholderiaceae bacterium]
MIPIENAVKKAGLELVSQGVRLSDFGADWLHNSPLLEDCSPGEADVMGSVMLVVRAQPGQVLVTEGDVGDWMMLVLRGTVDVTRRTFVRAGSDADLSATAASGEVTRLAVIRAGAAAGEMSMLDGEPRYATCSAIEVVEAGLLTRKAIATLIHEHPSVGAKLLVKLTQLLAQRLRNTSNQLVKALEKAQPDRRGGRRAGDIDSVA